MKKSIIYLGIAWIAMSNVSFATNNKVVVNPQSFISNHVAPTPLCLAISKGEFELVKKFIEYGADVNEKSNGMTPLMVAARYNKVEIIKFLLEKGANSKEKDSNGFTALRYAELSNAKEAVTLFGAI
jgi:ankyrin repeat protein